MATTRSCLEAPVPVQWQVEGICWMECMCDNTWNILELNVIFLASYLKVKLKTLREVASFVLQWYNHIISHRSKHKITQTYNFEKIKPHLRTSRKALAEIKPRSSSWRFQKVESNLTKICCDKKHLKCLPTKTVTFGCHEAGNGQKILPFIHFSIYLRAMAAVSGSWPKATREMPKSQTLISPLRLNLAEQQVDSRQMALTGVKWSIHNHTKCFLNIPSWNEMNSWISHNFTHDIGTFRCRVKFFHICPKWRSHVFNLCWFVSLWLPGSTFLVAKSRCRIPRWCKQPVASSTSQELAPKK